MGALPPSVEEILDAGVTTVICTASNSVGTAQCSFTVTINDNDLPTVTLTATTPNASEAGSNGVFRVSQNGCILSPFAVSYKIAGTASNGLDYVAIPTTVTIPAGQSNTTVTIAPLPDDLVAKVCRDLGGEPGLIPYRLVRGVHAPTPSVYRPYQLIFGRDDMPEELLLRLQRRLGELRMTPLPLLDPAPTGRFQVASAMPPAHYEGAVTRAVELIAAGELQKIVLAREVQVHAPRTYEPAAVFAVLREEFPSCFCFCVGRGDATLIAASPELLVRREGHRVSTLALAGSTRRSADPAVDAHLGEQLLRDASYREEHAIVARRIERMLRPHAIWVTAAEEPALVRIANIQHLATPIRAQLATPLDALELAGLMHPTPAVGGEPLRLAAPLIPALEGLDRGWYSGPVGWTDATGDGEFCVALRCALLRGGVARCYAGNGIVRDSEPASELAETEVKLQALLPLLTG